MMIDFFMANQGTIISWMLALVFLVVTIFVMSRFARVADDEEITEAFRKSYRLALTAFAVTTVVLVVVTAVVQIVNLVPRKTEDRVPAERDQEAFERRIKDQQFQQKREMQK